MSLSSIAGDNFDWAKVGLANLDVVDSYEAPLNKLSFVQDFEGKIHEIKDPREISLKEADVIGGVRVEYIDRVFIKNDFAKALLEGGDGSGGVHRTLGGIRFDNNPFTVQPITPNLGDILNGGTPRKPDLSIRRALEEGVFDVSDMDFATGNNGPGGFFVKP